MKMQLSKKITVVMVSVIAAIGLTACTNYVGKFTEALNGGQFEEAVSIYQQNEFKDEDLRNIGSDVEELLETKLDQYAKNEIQRKDLNEVLTMASKFDIDRVVDTLDYVKNQASKLDVSKGNYSLGIDMFNNGDYRSAYSLFSGVIKDDANYTDASAKIKDCVTKYCDSIKERCAGYVQRSDYDGALAYLESVKTDGDFSNEILDFIKDKENELIVPSVTAVVDEYIRKNDYYSAYTYLETQIDEKRLYSNDQVIKYEDTIISSFEDYLKTNVDKFMAGNDYEGAIAFLDSQKSVSTLLGTDSWDQLSQNVGVKYVLSKAEGYVKDNDIASALAEITNYKETNGISENTELDTYAQKVSDEYVKMILERVIPLEEKEEYLKALTILSNAQNVVNAPEFAAEVEKINEVKPTYLCDVKCSNWGHYEQITSGEMLTDTIGNKYELNNLFEMSSTGVGSGWTGFADYYLGYKYKTLTGMIAVSDKSQNTSARLIIEGDNKQIYSTSLNRSTAPISINFDVSNINWLSIKLIGDNAYDLYIILSDFQLSEDGLEGTSITPEDNNSENKVE
jgi:hypothetical protein